MPIEFITQTLLLCAILIDASLAWLVLLKNPKNATNQSYFALISCITLWQIATFIALFFLHTDSEKIYAFRLLYAAVIAALMCILYFVNMFGDEEHHRPWPVVVLIASSIHAVAAIATPWLFEYSLDRRIFTGQLYPYVIFLVCALIAGIFASIVQRLLMVEGERLRAQLEYMMIGLFVPMLFGVFSTVIVPFVESADNSIILSQVQIFGATTTVFFSFVIAYAMARHRLMDVRVALKRKSVALFLTLVLIFIISGIVLYAASQTLVLNIWTSIGLLVVFGVVTVLLYEVLQKTVALFLKRGIVDFTVHTRDERVFMKNIKNPRSWSRGWAGKLQKKFGVDTLQCITYDHRAQCWHQVFPKQPTTYALEERWIREVQSPEIRVRRAVDAPEHLARFMREHHFEVAIVMHDAFRCIGAWFLGKKLDGTAWTADDMTDLEALCGKAEVDLWYVIQQEYMVVQAMEDGVEIPPELLVEKDEE